MKKIVLLIIMLYSAVSMACEMKTYRIYYTPLDTQFFVPPTRGDLIKHGIKYDINSSKLTCLFDLIFKQSGNEPKAEDLTGFRIVIQDKKTNKELIITTDKAVFSKNKIYNVDAILMEDILKELLKSVKKLESTKSSN